MGRELRNRAANRPVLTSGSWSSSRRISPWGRLVDVDLMLIPAAVLTIGGPITFDHLGPDNWGIHATAQNTGSACATSIGSVITLTGNVTRTLNFSLPTSTVVHPGESFQFLACCLADADLNAFGPPVRILCSGRSRRSRAREAGRPR
jgi:hypothetical protein